MSAPGYHAADEAATRGGCARRSRAYAGRMRRGLLPLLVLGLATAAAAGSLSGPLPNAGPPLLLRLEGVLEPSAEAARSTRLPVASLGFLGEGSDIRRWLGVTKARTFGGDQALDGKAVLALLAPFTPNLLVTGPRAIVAELRDLPPGTAVRIEGLVSRGARTYYLRRVEVTGDAQCERYIAS